MAQFARLNLVPLSYYATGANPNKPHDGSVNETVSVTMASFLPPAPSGLKATSPAAGPAKTGQADANVLVVPHGIRIVGMIRDADSVRVEGEILTPYVKARELVVPPGGAFTGTIEVEAADIGGRMDGTLHVRGTLIVRSSGSLMGAASCNTLHVDGGAQINASLQMIGHHEQDLPSQPAFDEAVVTP